MSFWRGRTQAYHWDAQPVSFLLQASVGLAEILVVGLLAWGCLRLALAGRLRQRPDLPGK